MELNYSTITQYGMLNQVNYNTMYEKYGRCLNFKEVNRYLFGTSENLINICNMDLVKKEIIFKDGENIR